MMSSRDLELQLPNYATSEATPGFTLISIPYMPIFLINVVIAVGSLSTCVTLGYALHFEGVTYTDCKVPNVVPSISAITGGFTPERYIWRYGMAYFSWPRTFDSFLIYQFFATSSLNRKMWYSIFNKISWLCYVVEHVSLFTLTYVSSTENYAIHEKGFIFFVACSTVHMVLSTYLFKHAHPEPRNYKERMSWRLRSWSMTVFFLSLLLSAYFFVRHNQYCEPYMYSFYGICEYVVILSNISFHFSQYYDLQGFRLKIYLPLIANSGLSIIFQHIHLRKHTS